MRDNHITMFCPQFVFHILPSYWRTSTRHPDPIVQVICPRENNRFMPACTHDMDQSRRTIQSIQSYFACNRLSRDWATISNTVQLFHSANQRTTFPRGPSNHSASDPLNFEFGIQVHLAGFAPLPMPPFNQFCILDTCASNKTAVHIRQALHYTSVVHQ